MKIATFNINNVNKRLANVLAWLRKSRPDIACLQELKSTDADFPVAPITKVGYDAVWRGQRSWNGVAILGRGREPVLTRNELPGDPTDTQSRYLEAAVGGVLIATLYAPNGNPQPGPKFDYKLAWMKRLLKHASELWALDAPVVLAGDFNVVPTEADIYPSKSYAKNALVQPEPRALFRKLLKQGWIDAIRKIHPDEPMYTFWDYKRDRWQRDAGLRLDHLLLNAKAAKLLTDAGVDREVRGVEGASDMRRHGSFFAMRPLTSEAKPHAAKSEAVEKDDKSKRPQHRASVTYHRRRLLRAPVYHTLPKIDPTNWEEASDVDVAAPAIAVQEKRATKRRESSFGTQTMNKGANPPPGVERFVVCPW